MRVAHPLDKALKTRCLLLMLKIEILAWHSVEAFVEQEPWKTFEVPGTLNRALFGWADRETR